MSHPRFPVLPRPKFPGLSQQAMEEVIGFTLPAFGDSNWNTRTGAEQKPYYFNFDLALAGHGSEARNSNLFVSHLSDFIKRLVELPVYKDQLGGQDPVLGYVCPEGGPTGIIQTRALMNDLLPWPSIQIFPGNRLVRKRVIGASDGRAFPESIKWLWGRNVLLLTDAATTGSSLAEAKGALNSFGCGILAAVAVYDRDEGACESLEKLEVHLFSLYNAGQFVQHKGEDPQYTGLAAKVRNSAAAGRGRNLADGMSRCA